MNRANGIDSTDSGERLPLVEVCAHPKFNFGSLALICVLCSGVVAAASVVVAVVPLEELKDARLEMLVLRLVAAGLGIWTGGMAIRRWRERQTVTREIARILGGESLRAEQVAQLAWQSIPLVAFTPESLEALEVAWKTKLPRVWAVLPEPQGWLARLLDSASAKPKTQVVGTARPELITWNRRLIWPATFIFSLAFVVGMSGAWMSSRHPTLGSTLAASGFIIMVAAISQLEGPRWINLQDSGGLRLRRLRHSRWPWAAKTGDLPTLEVMTDRDVVVLLSPVRRVGPEEATRYCQLSVALRAVPRGTPTDFRGHFGEGLAAARLPAAAGEPTVSQ